MRVMILGCGPAGLVAAQAALDSGADPYIISKTDNPSMLYGCQYLHAPIPGYEDIPSTTVSYALIGTPEEYRAKVYGDKWHGKVSPEDFVGEHSAWDIRETYGRLWARLIGSGRVPLYAREPVSDGWIPASFRPGPDYIISTIPAPAMCRQRSIHAFNSHVIFANGTTNEEPIYDNAILCDGTEAHSWYRVSNVFGYRTIEWSRLPPPGTIAANVIKPLSTDCDCYPSVIRVGRYGTWDKSYLVHRVYPDVTEALRPSPGSGADFLDERQGPWRM